MLWQTGFYTMPEFRQNPATKEWVVLAPERGKRPRDVASGDPDRKDPAVAHDANCPFCAGNESMTLDASYRYPEHGDWQVRVVPNKFAALQSDLSTERQKHGGFLSADGYGVAEVVIEHPRHDQTLATLSSGEVTEVLRAYRERQRRIEALDQINLVTIFRNHGARAGTSLRHPHSQIIATPIVPPHVRDPIYRATMHYDETGDCVYCGLVEEELRQATRIILETKSFAAFCPFAARSPFETRIYPKVHLPSFHLTNDDQLAELGEVLRTVLKRLYVALENPDYNLVIRSAPVGDHDVRYMHWYVVIVPRLATAAGFEIGTGIYVNTVAPEESARVLRETNGD